VEDDKHIVGALTIRLEAAGYEVLTATNGFDGVKQAIAGKPDLVLMDIWMPVGLGFSVAQRLEQLGLGDIPIIFITASKVEGLRKAASGLGAVGFLEKPYDPQELLATISAGLDPDWRRQHDRLNSPRPDGSSTK
jgi:DNA-binding response OmpR family regulator